MLFLNEKYITLLKSLIDELGYSKKILTDLKANGRISDSKKIIEQYERFFLKDPISTHIEFKISFVGKSTHSLIERHLSEDNANRHIVLNLKSNEAIWVDQLYDNRLTDLLKFFKHLFSVIENYSIYQNLSKLEKFDSLIDEISNDIDVFIKQQIEADKKQPNNLIELQQQEAVEKEHRITGTKFKSNWQMFVNVILDNHIECLYHFTAESNIDSIKRMNGLFSWSYSEANNIKIVMPGGDELSRKLDIRKGAENYVRLSFCKDHPMEFIARNNGRISNPIKLLCNTELIYLVGTKFCNMNATKNEAVISDDIDYFRNINFKICTANYLSLNPIQKSQYQSEVLVYEHIPSKYILNFDKL